MRIEELYKLKITDIEIDNGISILNISKAKTKAGRRKIPIHSKISELIESYKKASKDDFLFIAQEVINITIEAMQCLNDLADTKLLLVLALTLFFILFANLQLQNCIKRS